MSRTNNPILISACLLGVNTRYDGTNALHKEIIKKYSHKILIPICPEQLGGLPTPRPKAEVIPPIPSLKKKGNVAVRVIDINGRDATKEFINGANEVLKIAKLLGASKAVLKEKSPSCGVNRIYRDARLVEGTGITARLLKDNGIDIEGVGL